MRSYKIWGLVILLGFLTGLITILPMLKFGPAASFYTIDPDVQYLSNSFSYIEKHQIQYDVHPGIPTIILHAWAMLPLRIYAKLVARTPFITWVLFNAEAAYYYVRIFQSIWLSLGMFVFLWSIFRFTKSTLMLITAWLGMFVYTVFPYFGSTIVPETTSFLLTAVWLMFFVKSYKSVSARSCLWLSIIAGLAVANKFSNLTLVPITALLVWYIPKMKIKKRIVGSFLSILVVVATFVVATWPIRRTYLNLWRWISVLASTTGTHGGGERAIFDLTAFLASASSLIQREWWPTVVMAVTLVLLLIIIFRGKIRPMGQLSILVFVTLVTTVIFAKFPLSHYQLTNYTLIVFALASLLAHSPRLITLVLMTVLIPAVSNNLNNYRQISSMAMDQAVRLERYVGENPSSSGTLWEWARVKDFSFLWGRDWAHGIFDKELSRYRPGLLAITSDLEKIKVNNRELRNVFDVCWDKFYIQTATAEKFMARYASRPLKYSLLPGINDIALIESDHCQGIN